MGRASIEYINKDYESIRQELLAKVPQLTDRWTDFNHSDLGVVLLELFCGVGDMLAYYLDAQAAEAFLPTARQRQNIINLCKLIGYQLDTPVSSTTTIRFSLAAPLDFDLPIPAGTQCRALLEDGKADFETVDDAFIPRGELSVDIYARQGIRKSEELEATGKPWQRFHLSGASIAQATIRVLIDDDAWSEVRHFQESDSDSLHFMADTNALDITSILFGDGQSGAVPAAGKTISVSWLESLGAMGNIGPGRITQLLSAVYHDGAQIPLTVSNPVAATGGSSRETIQHARNQAPAELRSLWKAVTLQDYKALAEGYPGVAKAKVLDTNDCQNIRYYNVHLAIAPNGGGMPSGLLKRDLAEYLEHRKVITVEVKLFDPVYRSIHIDCEVYAWPGEALENVRSRIESSLADFFAFDQVSFGQTIHSSDLIALIDGVRGVSHIRLYTPQLDVELGRGEIPVLGSVNLDMRRAE
ncbi:baseplate J/gp47 family protein [Desulfatibacillum aliphaticivorans]|uniref:baseplate J/gp47 family protein n=1 Tax=Desulfatibacillum aliphaticivorans TaxID=218208 RepID=UPI00041DCD0B|nr:baseplate J/gp47 family protein [Desulfatibacillum aliphaticivorans]